MDLELDLTKMFGDCIEWAVATCDKEFTVGEFFEMIEIRGSDFTYAAMLKQLRERGFFGVDEVINKEMIL